MGDICMYIVITGDCTVCTVRFVILNSRTMGSPLSTSDSSVLHQMFLCELCEG